MIEDEIRFTQIRGFLQTLNYQIEQQNKILKQILHFQNTQLFKPQVSLYRNLQNEAQIQVKVESDDNQTNFIQHYMLSNNMTQLKTQLKMYKRFHNLSQNHLEQQIMELPQYCINNFYSNSINLVDGKYQLKLNQISTQNQFNNIERNYHTNIVELDQNSQIMLSQINQSLQESIQTKIQNTSEKLIKVKKRKIKKNHNSKPKSCIELEKQKKEILNNCQSEDSYLMKNQQLQTDEQQNQFFEKKSTYQRPKIIRKENCQFCKSQFQTLQLLLCHQSNRHGIIRNSSEIIEPNYLTKKIQWEQQKVRQKLEIQNKQMRKLNKHKLNYEEKLNIDDLILEQPILEDKRQEQKLEQFILN